MTSARVEFEIRRIRELPTHSAKMQYIHNIPRGIRARVVGEILDRGRGVIYMERMQREMIEQLRLASEREDRYNPFSCPHFNN